MLYRFLLRPLLYMLPPETAHHLAFGALRFFCAIPGMRALVAFLLAPRDEALAQTVWDIRFPTPVGLAAGFDKDAKGFEALFATGFGFVEVGTLTGEAQPGNPQPRLFRLPADRALINRMGFNNQGSADAVARLAKPRTSVLGVNIGKTKVVPEEEALADYVKSAERIARLSDYAVVNVSSPNTPGLRDLQSVEKLRPLLAGVREALDRCSPKRRVPLLVKIAPDLSDEDVDAVADMAVALDLDGVIASNTTIRRAPLVTPEDEVKAIGAGGLSGPILAPRAREVLARLRARVGKSLVLISVGGIETAEEAYARLRAGATLVQVYTAYIYEGPMLPRRIALGVRALMRRDGFSRIEDVIGVDAPSP